MLFLKKKFPHPLYLISIIFACLAITATGLLVIIMPDHQTKNSVSFVTEDCLAIRNPQPRQICQSEQLDQILLTGNITQAFDLIKEYYKKDLLFQKQCHSFSHRIGEKGYDYFSQHKHVELGDNTSYCGFGFYHGFLEAMVHKTNDVALAREFCNYVALQAKQVGKKAESSCYHGIGHGTVDGSDPRSWGNPYKIVEPGLEICEKVTTNERFLYQCAGGIFNSLAIMYTYSQNGLERQQNDPFNVCYAFKDEYLEACLSQMNTYIISLAEKDLDKIGAYVENVPQSFNPTVAMDSAASYLAASTQDPLNYGEIIKTCKGFRQDLITSCISGYAAGLIEFGPPGKEYEAPLVFCQHQLLNEDHRTSCFKRSLSYLQVIYPSQQLKTVCTEVDTKYRTYCSV